MAYTTTKLEQLVLHVLTMLSFNDTKTVLQFNLVQLLL